MQGLRTLPVVLLMCAAGLAGCTGDNTKKADSTPSPSTSSSAPSPSDSASGSTSSSFPSTPPSKPKGPKFPRDRIEAASMHLAYLNSSVATTPQEKAVVAAWMDYWQGASDVFYLYKQTDQFLAVARGKAKKDVLDYVAQLKKANQRVVGWAKDNVTEVSVKGDTATVQDCTENFTYNVDREIEPLTRPTPFYGVSGTLHKEDGRWTVTRQKTKTLKKSCLS